MKTLVAYYSRTGTTRKVALTLAEMLGADVEEIREPKKRGGFIGWILAVKDALRKKTLPIEPPRYRPREYDLVIVGTPVWTGTMATAVRSYLAQVGGEIRRPAFFCTLMGRNPDKTFKHMESLCASANAGTLVLRAKHVKKDLFAEDLKTFADKITGG